jgi:hypothetical protein
LAEVFEGHCQPVTQRCQRQQSPGIIRIEHSGDFGCFHRGSYFSEAIDRRLGRMFMLVHFPAFPYESCGAARFAPSLHGFI